MKRPLRAYGFVALMLAGVVLAQSAGSHSAVTPVPRTEESWLRRQQQINERVRQGNVDLIFIGDSITQGWESAGRAAWEKHYARRNAANLGIGGDRTQHVLWRLDHGNLEGIRPRAAVVMIGTNNSNGADNTAQEIAEGITAIIHKLGEKLPQTKVLLLAVFPRGQTPDPQREKIAKVNSLIAGLHDGQRVHFMDIGPNLTNPDGAIYPEIMPDFLHLSPKGYEIWAASIETRVAELMGEK